ncbi:MAG: hypothetical protein IJF84_00385 [Thermoguttaceae bacterium]|nr:hypothetical protein [Thermoguttaceae bacterium]
MNCKECIEQMNKIDWGQSNLDIYYDMQSIVFNYNNIANISLCDALSKLWPTSRVEYLLIEKLQRFGLNVVLKLLEHIDPNDPPNLFKLSEDDHLEEASELDVRDVWIKIMDRLTKDMYSADSLSVLSAEESEAVWVDEDDDFLTGRKTA